MAVEQVASCLGDVRIFLSAQASEIGSPELLDSLERLRQRPGGETRLVLQVPYEALVDHAAWDEFHEQLRDIGVQLALDQFAGSAAQLTAWKESPPDYLRMAATGIQGLGRSPDQRQRVQEVIQAAKQIGTQVIACGVKNEEEWHACKSLGIALAQGDYAAASLPLDGIHR
jgi:EAL domain-containing protein (putative c-di-GMP-specific phosphodiesterase class I)